jgi:hypothetical protein
LKVILQGDKVTKIEQRIDGWRDKMGDIHDILPNGMRIYIRATAPVAVRQLFAVAWKNLRLVTSRGEK